MGLDLFCTGTESIKMGSYKAIQEIRLHWMFAYIQYLQITHPLSSIIQELVQCVHNSNIDYGKFSKLSNKDEIGLSGLFEFVHHSDCDGFWEPSQIKDIIDTLHLIRQYLKPITYSWHFYNEDQYYLDDIFKFATENDEFIRFA